MMQQKEQKAVYYIIASLHATFELQKHEILAPLGIIFFKVFRWGIFFAYPLSLSLSLFDPFEERKSIFCQRSTKVIYMYG